MELDLMSEPERGTSAAREVRAPMWAPAFRLYVADAAPASRPPALPSGIEAYRQAWRNPRGQITFDPWWTAAPRRDWHVAALVTWAREHGWRASLGRSSGPIPSRTLVIDPSQHLTRRWIEPGEPAAVTAEVGVRVEDLRAFLRSHERASSALEAMGGGTLNRASADSGVGPVLHHLVLSFSAVVWDDDRGRFAVRIFDPRETSAGALLRAPQRLVTSLTLRTTRIPAPSRRSDVTIERAEVICTV